ncbi:hypothetical protein ASG88_20120 [Nocardioides sp. Soil777]|nr:hypothetical protein ASG88_20120 [Nocardioides sp. Soil777]
MAVADEVTEEKGDRDVAAWCQRELLVDRGAARRDMTLAGALERRWTVLAQAHRVGDVSTAQADVVARALDDLPDDTPSDIRAEAERVLVGYAATFAPKELRRLGSRILDIVAPGVGEEQERKKLEGEERKAPKTTSLTTRSHGDGSTTIRIRVPDATADRLLTYLHAWTNPRKHDAGQDPAGTAGADAGTKVSYPTRLGHAFCTLLEHLDPNKLPRHGGTATSVVVTMDYDTMMSGLGVATTNTGGRISASEARRLMCTSHVIPAVLGGKSEVLDLGRGQRLYKKGPRRAMDLRDKHCRAEGCDIPAAWCEAHHLIPWLKGGKTDLADGILLCSHHHHRAHDDRYLHDRLPNGDLRFHHRR